MASQMPYATYTQQPQQFARTNSNSFGMQGGGGGGQYATVSGHPMPQASPMGAAIHAWVPIVPQELQYYDLLFNMADEEHRNSIGGRIAVAFFSRSNVDKSVLREIWSIADSQQRSELSRNEFYVAMRLIAMAQRGEPVSIQRFFETASMPHPLPMLEGVPPPPQLGGAAPPASAYQTHPGYAPAPPAPTGGGYAVTEEEKAKYDGIFQQYDTDRDGFLMGAEAVGLFQMSGLDRNILRDIWSIADRGQDSKLDVKEFYVAMHLIVCISKRGLPMPTELPADLAESAFGHPTPRSSFTLPINPGMPPTVGAGSGPPSRAGSVHGQEAVHADPMDTFAGLSPAKDSPMPNMHASFTSAAQSPPLSTSSSVDYTSTVNHPPTGDQPPNSTGSFSGMGGLPGPSSTRSSHDWSHTNSPSLAPTPTPAAPAPEQRTNSTTGWNARSSFTGAAAIDGMNHPGGAEQQAANMQRMSGGNFMPMQMNMPPQQQQQAPPAPAAVQKPFMSDAEEHMAAQQLEQHNEQLVQSLTSIERKQAAIEKLSSKLRELDQLRHELVTLCMKRDSVRSATQAASASSLSSNVNHAELEAKRVVEASMHGLIAAEKEVLQKLQGDISAYEQQLEGSISAPFDATSKPPPPVAKATHAPVDISGSGGFDAFGSKPAAPSSSSGFDAFGSPSAHANPPLSSPAAPSSSGFDAFNAFGSSPLPQPTSTTSNDAFDAFSFN